MKNGFITFEGCEGSGKTTVIKRLEEDMKKAGFKVFRTREPGGSAISEQIRNVILNVDNKRMDYMTEALLYAASRRQHLEEIIKPALAAGAIVLCDRYIDSSLAYQGYARGLGIDKIYALNMDATSGFLPDLTVYIDVPAPLGLERINKNHRDVNRIDLENGSFHERVREGYRKISEKWPERIVTVSGIGTCEEVYERVRSEVWKRIDHGF